MRSTLKLKVEPSNLTAEVGIGWGVWSMLYIFALQASLASLEMLTIIRRFVPPALIVPCQSPVRSCARRTVGNSMTNAMSHIINFFMNDLPKHRIRLAG